MSKVADLRSRKGRFQGIFKESTDGCSVLKLWINDFLSFLI